MSYTLRIERRKVVLWWQELAAIVASFIVTLGIGAIMISLSGAKLSEAYLALFQGAFGSQRAILETLVQATPLIFTSLAVVVAYRSNYINLGGEGQFLMGAMAASGISLAFPSATRAILIPLQILAGCLAGGAWAFIPAILKIKFGASEMIVTVMLNFVAEYLVSYLVSGPVEKPYRLLQSNRAVFFLQPSGRRFSQAGCTSVSSSAWG